MMVYIASCKRLIFFFAILGFCACKQPKDSDFLYLVTDPADPEIYGYANMNGEVIIPLGKYPLCYTDTLKNFAIVMVPQKGLVAIDKNEKHLFEVFPFNNGPDEPTEGFFRIIKAGKIGFANMKGEIVIPAQYECAHSFKNGKAEVGLQCSTQEDGEHFYWESDNWFYIDTTGKRIE